VAVEAALTQALKLTPEPGQVVGQLRMSASAWAGYTTWIRLPPHTLNAGPQLVDSACCSPILMRGGRCMRLAFYQPGTSTSIDWMGMVDANALRNTVSPR